MKILLKRVPKETDRKAQQQIMESWYEIVVEKYAPCNALPEIHIGYKESPTGSNTNNLIHHSQKKMDR